MSRRILDFVRSFERAQKKSYGNTKVLQSSFLPRSVVTGLGVAGLVAGTYYAYDSQAAIHEYVFCPLIRKLTDAESGHRFGVWALKYGLAPKLRNDNDSTGRYDNLEVDVFGTKLKWPIGLAAGMDKDGEAIDGLFDTGFAYVEIGSITPEPQPGNPKPRFFRLPKDEAVINRYGFNSSGHFNVLATLKMRFHRLISKFEKSNVPEATPYSNAFRDGKLLAINLGKNKYGEEVGDYVKGVSRMGPFADVLVVNVSSPNTPGLRDLQSESKLTNLLSRVVHERNSLDKNLLGKRPPVLVKIAPDLTEPEIESIANSAKAAKVDGVIVSNTTIQRPVNSLITTDAELIHQTGGLSGSPVKPYALKALKTLRKHTRDSNLVLVGCGGISSGRDALEFGKAGATFVQLYTSFAYKGPGLPARIRDELSAELKKEGKTWMDIVGEDVK